VLSIRHSKVSWEGAVWLSVPANSNLVEELLLAGARSMVVSGGLVSGGSRTSHSYSVASCCSLSSRSVAMIRSRCGPAIRLV